MLEVRTVCWGRGGERQGHGHVAVDRRKDRACDEKGSSGYGYFVFGHEFPFTAELLLFHNAGTGNIQVHIIRRVKSGLVKIENKSKQWEDRISVG